MYFCQLFKYLRSHCYFVSFLFDNNQNTIVQFYAAVSLKKQKCIMPEKSSVKHEQAKTLLKFLAAARVASRRKAEVLIRQGKVRVNGEVVIEPAFRIDPAEDKIVCEGKPVILPEKRYFLLNKPEGYITTVKDTHNRPTVLDLIPESSGLFPVGRLDKDTTGLLLLTNDGDLAYRLTHPKFEVAKTYRATVKGKPGQKALKRLELGIEIEGRMTAPAKVRLLAEGKERSRVQIRIHEGRKRQVKLMFAAVGYPVIKLTRTAYGNLKLGNSKPGQYRKLTVEELEGLRSLWRRA